MSRYIDEEGKDWLLWFERLEGNSNNNFLTNEHMDLSWTDLEVDAQSYLWTSRNTF